MYRTVTVFVKLHVMQNQWNWFLLCLFSVYIRMFKYSYKMLSLTCDTKCFEVFSGNQPCWCEINSDVLFECSTLDRQTALSTWDSRGKHDIHLFQPGKSATTDHHRCFQESSVLVRTVEYMDCLVKVSLCWSWNQSHYQHNFSNSDIHTLPHSKLHNIELGQLQDEWLHDVTQSLPG
jgi:hypothetical protein